MSTDKGALSHIAIIMDGNGRWAEKRGLDRTEGHRQGLEVARRLVAFAANSEVKYLTLFAFSHENWKRPAEEVGSLLGLFSKAIIDSGSEFRKNKIKLNFIGDLGEVSRILRSGMKHLKQMTANDDYRLLLTLALGYSGRWDIVQAMQKCVKKNEMIDAHTLEVHLATGMLPPPDLLIRTGGEKRISNFMLWQLAYTELYFSDVLWPDFDEDNLLAAIENFYQRDRRFGQIQKKEFNSKLD